jgi:hypothetical protein
MCWDESGQDLLPEYCRYKDDGCELADSCLNCPFPDCIYVQPGGKQQWLKELRDREVLRLFTTRDKGVKELALNSSFSLCWPGSGLGLRQNPSRRC